MQGLEKGGEGFVGRKVLVPNKTVVLGKDEGEAYWYSKARWTKLLVVDGEPTDKMRQK